MALYNDLRPMDLDQIVGNGPVIQSLKQALTRQQFPHTILFHGPKGCGKTTLARIIARTLECKGVDLRELNAADTRGIDTVRAIIDEAYYHPLEGKSRVYILDEAANLTGAAQEALLKILEEPPTFCYFMLCTTDPGRIIGTIRNRCMAFEVRRLRPPDIIELLVIAEDYLKQSGQMPDNEQIPDTVLNHIVQGSDGCPRAALTMLEQCIGLTEQEALSINPLTVDLPKDILDLCRVLVKNDQSWSRIAEIIKRIEEDPEAVRRAILGYLKTVLLSSNSGDTRIAGMIKILSADTYNGGFPQLAGMLHDCIFWDI